MVASLTVLDQRANLTGSPGFSPSTCNPNHRCGNGLEKIYPTSAVRYGYMNYIGEFRYAPGMLFSCGAKVVIQTQRGIEIGQQVSLTCTGCDKSVKRQTMLDYVKKSGPDFYKLKSGRILREATPQDVEENRRICEGAREKLKRAEELASELALPMKFVACEPLFGGERIIFHFMADGRVDFRELVRRLAHDYHTRIEMHQVGARDEARLVADYEICGRECCCKNFLKTLRPVTMRMAKLQKATLDPSKVSGRCGRLRCCLRYEHEGYEELDRKLPRVGVRVETDRGIGTVRDRQVLTQLLTIEYDQDGHVETVGEEAVIARNLPRRDPGAPPAPQTESGERRSDRRPQGRGDRRKIQKGADQNVPRPTQSPPPDQQAANGSETDQPSRQESAERGSSGAGPDGSRGRRRGRRSRRAARRGERRRNEGNVEGTDRPPNQNRDAGPADASGPDAGGAS